MGQRTLWFRAWNKHLWTYEHMWRRASSNWDHSWDEGRWMLWSSSFFELLNIILENSWSTDFYQWNPSRLHDDGFSLFIGIMPNRAMWEEHSKWTRQITMARKELSHERVALASLIKFINLGPRRHGLCRWHCKELTVSWEARWEAMATMYTASYIRAASVCGEKHTPHLQFHLCFPSFTCIIILPASLSPVCLISIAIYSPAEQFSLSDNYFFSKIIPHTSQ